MRLRLPALVVVAVACVAPGMADAAGGRAGAILCKQSCGSTIAACTADGGRQRKCRRQVLKRCKREGITVCIPPGTYSVATSGSNDATCGTPAAPCRTIQFVVDTLVPAEGAGVIKVAAGTYDDLWVCPAGAVRNEAVVCVINKQVVLLGGFEPPNWDQPAHGPDATVLDGHGRGRGVRVVRGGEKGSVASVEMDAFTIANGFAEGGSDGSLSDKSAGGGGLYAEHSPVTLRNVVFRNNVARGGTTGSAEGGRGAGGGLSAYSGWPSVVAPMSLQNVTFDGNQAEGGDGLEMGGYALGGAMFTFAVPVTADGLVFTNNTAKGGTTTGDGVHGVDKADALGGALAVGIDGVVDLRHAVFSGNAAVGGDAPAGEAGGAFGGAVFVEQGTLTLSDVRLEDNRAQGGDGMNATATGSIAQGGAVQSVMGSLTLDRAIVLRNESRSGNGVIHGGVSDGGGIAIILGEFAGAKRPFMVRNSVVADNVVSIGTGLPAISAGGGVFVNGATGTIEHSTIADNRLSDPNFVGGGIALLPVPGWETHLVLVHSIVANHRTVGIHPRAYATAGLWLQEGTSAEVRRVLFANNLHHSNAGIDDPYNVPGGEFDIADVMTASDAGFVSAASPGYDYRLVAGSPAVDQAIGSTLAQDLAGVGRPVAAASDLGAYELAP